MHYSKSMFQKKYVIIKKKGKIKDEVDYDTPGSYEITYSAKSGKSRTGTVRLIVIVTE